MSFLLPLALLLAFTAVAPLLAHALKKGQARPLPFPAAHLVPARSSSAKERHRIQDRLLLLLRVLLLFCLALLAASPFVQCSRLSLNRTNGASVAAALVIDDSASMRALTKQGRSRLDAAISGAKELLETAEAGDSFSIVLAGYPARVLVPSTNELGSVTDALDSIQASDRRTDLPGALSLARSLQAEQPHEDRPIVLLSDLAVDPAMELDLKAVVLPEGELREPFSNCALLEASFAGNALLVEVACTGEEASRGRELEVIDASGTSVAPKVKVHDGVVRLPLAKAQKKGALQDRASQLDLGSQLEVRLTEGPDPALDQIREDDVCPVLSTAAKLSVALRADRSKSGLKTGAGTVLRAAIEALDRGVRVQNLSLLPERSSELDPYSALFIDDPSGFTPEIRDALSTWVTSGGVGVLLLGPGIERAPLGADFSPFLRGAPTWSAHESSGVDPKVSYSLGPLSSSWTELGASKRALISEEADAEAKVRWDDGQPLILERLLGRGSLISVTLPSSVDQSDLALRPAFLEFVDYVLTQSAVRRGARATPVGERWALARNATVIDPDGKVVETQQRKAFTGSSPDREVDPALGLYVEPSVAGRYRVSGVGAEDQGSSFRYAMRDLSEHTRQPAGGFSSEAAQNTGSGMAKVGISREIALLALVLGALELAFRAFRRGRPQLRPATSLS